MDNFTYISTITGVGQPDHLLNDSKLRTLHPILKVDDAPRSFYDWDCPIAAIELTGFSPNKIINIISNAESVVENTYGYCETKLIPYNPYGIFTIPDYPASTASGTLSYLLTDKVSNNQNGKKLYYQYELMYDCSTDNNIELSIYKNNEVLMTTLDYLLEFSTDLLSAGNSRYSDTTWIKELSDDIVHRVRILLPIEVGDKEDFYIVKYKKSLNNATIETDELVDIKPIYEQDVDFSITGHFLSFLTAKVNTYSDIFIVKDPEKLIKPLDIMVLKDNIYQSDKTSSWRLKLNVGSFKGRLNPFTNIDGYFYKSSNIYNNGYIPVVSIKPELITTNILKIDEYPIYLDSYTYPNYEVQLYDPNEELLADIQGKIAVQVNGKARTDLKIKSIDTKKGFIYFENAFSNTDEIEISCYVEASSYLMIPNLELNPKIPYPPTDEGFHISGYLGGVGIAYRPYDPNILETAYPYLYNPLEPVSSRTCYLLQDLGDSTSTYSWNDNMFSVCELNINHITTDIVKITDARRVGGGVNINSVDLWFKNELNDGTITDNEQRWYTGIGNYDGLPLAHASTIMIHIPIDKIDELRQKWIDEVGLNPDVTNPVDIGTKGFNAYLDQTIRKYISAGTDYILIPTESDGTFSTILNLEY